MKKERKALPVARLELNAGQIDWLPRNPRQWTKEDVAKTAKSIAEDEDFLEERPILVVPMGDKFVVFAGNLRSEGAKKRKMKEAPCVIYKPETEADQQAIIRRAAKDKTKQGFVYPDNIVTSAILGKIAKRDIELKIRKAACEAIKQSDSAEEQGRALYGGGFIMSDRAAAERAAAERAAATRLNLSEREKAIIERLNEQDK